MPLYFIPNPLLLQMYQSDSSAHLNFVSRSTKAEEQAGFNCSVKTTVCLPFPSHSIGTLKISIFTLVDPSPQCSWVSLACLLPNRVNIIRGAKRSPIYAYIYIYICISIYPINSQGPNGSERMCGSCTCSLYRRQGICFVTSVLVSETTEGSSNGGPRSKQKLKRLSFVAHRIIVYFCSG